MKQQPETSLERPLDAGSKFFLTLRAVALIFFFYAFCLATILLLSLWLALETVLGFVGGWFVRTVALRRGVREHFGLLKTVLRGLRLEKSIDARIRLEPDDAPELFQLIESLCIRTETALPRDVFLEMQLNAWVRLQGWRRGGAAVLGVGFDLFAGLSQRELETVLAHELTHAKLTQRAIRDWLANGLERAVKLVRALASRSRGKVHSSGLRRMLLRISESFAESAAGWIAAVFRQEEFEADRGAAELCGVARSRRVLLKVESLSRFTAQLPWRERVAQLQAHTFSPWLINALAAVKHMDTLEVAAQIPDRFSTHPSLRERLNALAPAAEPIEESEDRPAIELLADPDELAEKLMSRIEQTYSEQEERDSKALRRWAREMREAAELRPVQKAAAWLVIATEVAGAAAWIVGAGLDIALAILSTSVLGLVIYWRGRRQDRFTLPVPDFGLLKNTWATDREATSEKISAAVADFRKRANTAKGSGVPMLLAKSVESLAECDYVKAGAAAQVVLERNSTNLQPALIAAIASAWLGRGPDTVRALSVVQHQAGLRGETICWGVAWTYMMRGNWGRAEALLDQVLDKRPDDPTLLNLRALCQSRRGKIQSAIISARRACHPRPRNREHAKFLIDLLLEGGYLREAQQWLLPLDDAISHDPELMLIAVRLNLLLHQFEIAEHWAEALVNSKTSSYMIVRLAVAYELSRQFAGAARYYQRALDEAFYPDACLGLARLDVENNNLDAARQHALDALNIKRPLGKYATPPLELLGPILDQLSALEPPTRFFQSWTGALPVGAAPGNLGGASFVVYALNQPQAERYLHTVLAAMSGEGSRLLPVNIRWRLSPPEVQPFGMARPGVQPLADGQKTHVFRGFNRHRVWQPHYAPSQTPTEEIAILNGIETPFASCAN